MVSFLLFFGMVILPECFIFEWRDFVKMCAFHHLLTLREIKTGRAAIMIASSVTALLGLLEDGSVLRL